MLESDSDAMDESITFIMSNLGDEQKPRARSPLFGPDAKLRAFAQR